MEELERIAAEAGLDILGAASAAEALRIVEGSPWKGFCLDWERLAPFQVWKLVDGKYWKRRGDGRSLSEVLVERASHLALIVDRTTVVAGPVESMIEHFDELVLRQPGRRYLVGAEVRDGIVHWVSSVLLEYDGADTVVGTAPKGAL
ncbi:MAG: hypothetical protein H6706_25285 [Myxococcales bacterium]|nr:hypothetical protein [Myxococcales bacterium]